MEADRPGNLNRLAIQRTNSGKLARILREDHAGEGVVGIATARRNPTFSVARRH